MEYQELVRILIRRWWLIALPVVLSAVISVPDLLRDGTAVSGGFNTQIRYSAAQQLNISDREGDYTDIWRASEYTVHAMTDWARSSSFRHEIASILGDAQAAVDGLQIAADNVRSVGVVYMSHPNGESLGAIADAAVLVLNSRSQRYFPQLEGEAAQVTILDQPAIVAAPPALPSRFAPFVRLAVALLIGLAIAVFAEFVDPTVYHQDDLRRMGMPLIGSIPKERV